MPAYGHFSEVANRGNAQQLVSILNRLWEDAQGAPMTNTEVAAAVDACTALVPREDEAPWVEEQAAAEDGAAAVAYALRCRQSGEAKESAWAGRRAYEALDHFVINQEGIDTNPPGAEQRVLSHPLVQAELARQRRDLDELLAIGDADVREVAARLRDRARRDAAIFFTAS
jgi:Protein of unknown function (DUF416)